MDEEIRDEEVVEEASATLKSHLECLQERVQMLEEAQKEIQETLKEHDERINACSIQR